MANGRQASWTPAVRRFLDYVEENSVQEVVYPGDSAAAPRTRPFMPIDQIQAYFSRNKELELRSIIKELSFQTDLYPKDILRRYTAVFCTLLHCGHGEYIELLRHKPSLSDSYLPFSVKNPPPGFPHGPEEKSLLAKFCREQWRFCAAVMEDSDSDKHYEEEQVLPIVYRERLAGGATANLWKIELHPTYNKIDPEAMSPVSLDSGSSFYKANTDSNSHRAESTGTHLSSRSTAYRMHSHTTTMKSPHSGK